MDIEPECRVRRVMYDDDVGPCEWCMALVGKGELLYEDGEGRCYCCENHLLEEFYHDLKEAENDG